MWNNGGRIIKLDWAKFMDMGSLSRDSTSSVTTWGVRRGPKSLFGWLKHR